MKLKGAEIIIKCLEEQGVDTVFGYPGGTVLAVYDALFTMGGSIRHILTSHEQGAAHAADGYARAAGKTGVCLVTSGPGATNLVTGIANAYMDSVPLVAITINVPRTSLGKDSFQEVDIAGVTMPVTKHNFIIKDIKLLAETMRRAFDIAGSGRPGPVLVDITRDVTEAVCDYVPVRIRQRKDAEGRTVNKKNVSRPSIKELNQAVRLIDGAERPLLLIGGGAVISGADRQVREFKEITAFPVVDSLMGKGVYPGTAADYYGMPGIQGRKAANHALHHADLIVAVGCRFSERLLGSEEGFKDAPHIIQIDIDRAEINKNVRVDLGLNGDAADILDRLCRRITALRNSDRSAGAGRTASEADILRGRQDTGCPDIAAARPYADWIAELDGYKAQESENLSYGQEKLDGPGIIHTLYEATEGQAQITTEVGLNQMWAARNYLYTRPGQLITSGGLGTMGFGLGAAIGASLARPDRLVVNVAGDGCFRMNMNELLTARRYGLPIIELVIENDTLGMVYEMQRVRFEGRYSATELDDGTDYRAIAAACGAEAVTAESRTELVKALKAAISSRKLSVIICRI